MGRAPTVYRYQSQEAYRGIGVVRSQSSGQNIAQSISASADRISAMAYRDAAIKAEEEGQKEALALEGDQITTLDPATGLPHFGLNVIIGWVRKIRMSPLDWKE